MSTKNALRWLFGSILTAMLVVTVWASTHQPIEAWGGLVRGPDRYWTIATMLDAYCGFVTFCVWVGYRERRVLARLGWFAAVALLGNMAMSAYVLIALARLPADAPLADLLTVRHPRAAAR
jgi:Protein of unknown function (DUF1475)